MQKHIQDARDNLQGLHALSHRTRESEKKILDSAAGMLHTVETEMKNLRPAALTSDDAGQRYQHLVLERGKLHAVIGRARAALGSD